MNEWKDGLMKGPMNERANRGGRRINIILGVHRVWSCLIAEMGLHQLHVLS